MGGLLSQLDLVVRKPFFIVTTWASCSHTTSFLFHMITTWIFKDGLHASFVQVIEYHSSDPIVPSFRHPALSLVSLPRFLVSYSMCHIQPGLKNPEWFPQGIIEWDSKLCVEGSHWNLQSQRSLANPHFVYMQYMSLSCSYVL